MASLYFSTTCFVHETKMHEFLSKLKAMESVVVGDPLLEETDVSALISKEM